MTLLMSVVYRTFSRWIFRAERLTGTWSVVVMHLPKEANRSCPMHRYYPTISMRLPTHCGRFGCHLH